MSIKQTTVFLESLCIDGSVFGSKFPKLIRTCECSENLMISIYHMEENRFLYYNKKFEENIGGHYNTLLRKGWNFWFSMIADNEIVKVKHQLFNFLKTLADQDSLTIMYTVKNHQGKEMFLKHEISLHKLEQQTLAINYFFDISEKEKIEQCLTSSKGENAYAHSKKPKALISPRELQVLQLIADGFSSKQIANQLFISNHTAISHRKHLIKKFQVKNTAQLIKTASRIIEL